VSRHALYIREIYTGEKEPSGAKDWVPLSKDGVLLKTNISRMSKSFPKVVWVYEDVVLRHLCSFPYEWPFTTLRYAEGIGPPHGRWGDTRTFRPGIDDV